METQTPQQKIPEIWQVEVNGEIYETNLEEMSQWIAEGALLPADKVRRGNLRWLEAQKVPVLHTFFNAKEPEVLPPNVSTTFNRTSIENIQTTSDNSPISQNFTQNSSALDISTELKIEPIVQSHNFQPDSSDIFSKTSCIIHTGAEPKYSCETCLNLFCKDCPSTYGSVKICPMCGAMCEPIAAVEQKKQKQAQFNQAITKGFGFSDFGKALAFPFKFKTSFIGGAILFMIFTLGQSASGIGGAFMLASAILCALLSNMLTFGILANTVENFSQGKIETNFMPDFEDFNLWDDVIHPFFLSLGVYLSSFGLLILLVIITGFFMMNSSKSEINSLGQKTVAATAPELQNDYADSSQTKQIKAITDTVKEANDKYNKQIESIENNGTNPNVQNSTDEEKKFNDLNEKINQARKQQLESTFGKTPETKQSEINQFTQNLSNVAFPFLLLGGVVLLWGLFYFPAACCVAGYTRNFGSAINPLVGLDTIKRLGVDYLKILGMTLVLVLISGIINTFIKSTLSAFDLPMFGNIPAAAVGSLLTFYFSIVFSVILGCALYKNSDRLNLFQ